VQREAGSVRDKGRIRAAGRARLWLWSEQSRERAAGLVPGGALAANRRGGEMREQLVRTLRLIAILLFSATLEEPVQTGVEARQPSVSTWMRQPSTPSLL
jgi:hypothetical protein